MGVEIRVLGGFEAAIDGRPVRHVDWQRAAAERLVKLLAITPGHAARREALAEVLWPGAAPGLAQVSLRKAIHFARQALPAGVIDAEGSLVRLSRCSVDVDGLVAALESLERSASAVAEPSSYDDESSAVGVVLDLGRRQLLPDDAYEDWAVPLREHLRSRWQQITLEVARSRAGAGRTGDALRIVDAILAEDPAEEAAHRLAIECLVAEGRLHAARRQMEWCRRALADVLDAAPQPETEAALAGARVTQPLARPGWASRSLVGRENELARMRSLRERVESGHAATIVLRGPAGIGKSCLLEALRDDARAAGWQELAWQAIPSASRMAFAPFALRLGDLVPPSVAWPEPEMSALATLVPATGRRPQIAFADRSALVFALFGVLRRLAERGPILLAIDDAAWIDTSTADVLEALSAVLAESPVLVALAVRDDEPLPRRVRDLIDRVVAAGALDLRVTPLGDDDVEPLVLGHLGGLAVEPALARSLATRSAGNPLFCLELVRSGVAAGGVGLVGDRWTADEGSAPIAPPETVRQLVRARTRALEEPTRELLQIAAMLGQEAPFAALRAVLGWDPGEVVRSLDDAMAAGLLVERGGAYAFAHPLYRAAVEASTGTAGRAVLDWRIARALAGAGGARAHPEPGPVAERAIDAAEHGLVEALPLAVEFGFEAGARALAVFERLAAGTLLRGAARAWQRLPVPDRAAFNASAALISLAELHMTTGDEAEARTWFRTAIDAARTPGELAIAYERFTWLPYRHGDFEGTLVLGREALLRLPESERHARAIVESQVGWVLGRMRRLEEAIDVLRRCDDAMEPRGDSAERSVALDRLGMMLDLAGRHDEAVPMLERALAVALACHDARPELCRIHLAAALTRSGRAGEARTHAARALELAHLMGDWYLEAVAAWSAAEVEDALGDLGAARGLRERELALLARVGGNPHNEAFSHAHLSHLARRMGEGTTAGREAALARALAIGDADSGYLARIESALDAKRWSDVASG